MSTKNEKIIPVQLPHVNETDDVPMDAVSARKTFVEPEVSFPVDVLESTTFFQFTESGATN